MPQPDPLDELPEKVAALMSELGRLKRHADGMTAMANGDELASVVVATLAQMQNVVELVVPFMARQLRLENALGTLAGVARAAEEREAGYVPVTGNHQGAMTEPMRARLADTGKALCPETDGMCEHASECRKPRGCWLRHARIAGEPEGRTTGLHRDSMG